MNAKTLLALVLVAILAVIAASLAVRGRRSAAPTPASDVGPVLEALATRGNDVALIRVESADETLTIVRSDDGWIVEEKGGYPVKFEEVAKTVSGLAQLELLEPKTANPERYDRLGVGEPGSGTSPAIRVTLEDGTGASLGSLIVGNRKLDRGDPGVYVRRSGEAQSWLAAGDLLIPKSLTGWIESEILKVEQTRIREAVITHPDGEVLRVHRDDEEQTQFAIDGTPEDRELLSPAVASPIGNALNWLNLEDVAPAATIAMGEAETTTATYRTFDGLVVTVRTVERDGTTWARLAAAYEEPVLSEDAETGSEGDKETSTTESAGTDATPGEDSAEASAIEDAAAETEAPTPPRDVRAEAAALNERLADWTFALPSYKSTYFRKRLEDLLKPPPAQPAESAPAEQPSPSPEGEHEDAPEGGAADESARASGELVPPTVSRGEAEQSAPAADDRMGDGG